MNSATLPVLGTLALVSLAYMVGKGAPASQTQAQPIVIQVPQAQHRGGDDRYRRAPRPQRFWDNGPEEQPIRGALDPIPTRGAPEAYQQMGVITTADNKVLPLYGRRTAPRSDYFNYYTRTDTYNPVALPVFSQRRDCQDNTGCQEIMSGDSLRLGATGETGKVTLYGFDGPRYSPEVD
jgi:hypothetical protein